MEQLFRQTDLEARVSAQHERAGHGLVPKVMSLREALQAFIDHRREVLERRTTHRLEKIATRLEVLEGYLAVYLNLDKVIKIIRTEDEPKPKLMKAFGLNDVQAEAILNMRLRSLRKLEEMEIRAEHDALTKEQKDLKKLLGSDKQWKKLAAEIKAVRSRSGRRPISATAHDSSPRRPSTTRPGRSSDAMVREPITVVVSEKGWIRALRGHVSDMSGVTFKTDDALSFAFPTETTAKILIFASNGKFYTLEASKLPGGRGHGEPVRLYFDIEQDADVVAALAYEGKRKFLVASYGGNGFVVPEDEVLGTTRKGKQVLNLKAPDKAAAMTTVDGELIASIGQNRKMVIFPLDQVPEMSRGRGVRLQRYKEKGLSDVKTFKGADGLTWIDTAGRSFTLTLKELASWRGDRGAAGRIRPDRFLTNNKFDAQPSGGKTNGDDAK